MEKNQIHTNSSKIATNEFGGITEAIILAGGLGIWYYGMTRKDFKSFMPQKYMDEKNDSILDA